jgi:hypothetical protein
MDPQPHMKTLYPSSALPRAARPAWFAVIGPGLLAGQWVTVTHLTGTGGTITPGHTHHANQSFHRPVVQNP